MSDETDPLARFGVGSIDLRWTLKDIAAKRKWLISQAHLPTLIELGLVEMRDGIPHLTRAGEDTIWQR